MRAIGVALAALSALFALRRRDARAAPARDGGQMLTGHTEIERARELLAQWEDAIRAYPSPMPPGALALIMLRESGGNERALARRTTEAFWECGLMQLVVEDDGRGEAKSADADPWHGPSNIYAAQQSYAADYAWLRAKLAEAGRELPTDDPVDSAVSLMALSRSIGRPGIVILATRTPELWSGSGTVGGWANALASRTELLPARLGVQSADKVAQRLRKAAALPAQARQVEDFPAQLEGPRARGPDVKPFPFRAADTPSERRRLKRWVESKGREL